MRSHDAIDWCLALPKRGSLKRQRVQHRHTNQSIITQVQTLKCDSRFVHPYKSRHRMFSCSLLWMQWLVQYTRGLRRWRECLPGGVRKLNRLAVRLRKLTATAAPSTLHKHDQTKCPCLSRNEVPPNDSQRTNSQMMTTICFAGMSAEAAMACSQGPRIDLS